MNDLLSLWRSPIDRLALAGAEQMAARQPRCDNTIPQLPPLSAPDATDVVAIWHNASGKTMGVPAGSFGGGAVLPIAFNTSFKPLTIYNYGNYVNVPGGSAASNTTAFNNMLADVNSTAGGQHQGGWVWIPLYSFQINATGAGFSIPPQTIMQGLGSSADAQSQFVVTPTTGLGDVLFSCLSPHTSGGTYFRNLGFKWASGTSVNDVCLSLQSWGCKVQDCSFMDVPVTVAFGGDQTGNKAGGLGCTMERCVIRYGVGRTVPNNATAIVMSGEEGQIIGPSEFIQQSISTLGPTGCVCVGWGGGQPGSEHQILRGVHISDWYYGIDFSNVNIVPNLNKGAQLFTICDNKIDAYGIAVNLTLQSTNSNAAVQTGNFYNNTMAKSGNSIDGKALVILDPLLSGGGNNINLAAIVFVGNFMYSNVSSGGGSGQAQDNQYGVLIKGGTGIHWIGGKIGNFGNNTHLGFDGSANVCFAASCGVVSFSDATLTPSFPGAGGGANGAAASQWAVLVSGALTGATGPVTFDNCDMTGYGAPGPIGVTGSIASGAFYVRNCAGYNDQNIQINTAAHLTTAAYAAYNQGANSGTSYYGPSYVFYKGGAGGTLSLNGGAALAIIAGQVGYLFLNSPYDTFQFSNAPASIQWFGK